MRTVRIKVYKFNELSEAAKEKALFDEISKFEKYFNINTPHTRNYLIMAKIEAKKRLEKYDFEFTADGRQF